MKGKYGSSSSLTHIGEKSSFGLDTKTCALLTYISPRQLKPATWKFQLFGKINDALRGTLLIRLFRVFCIFSVQIKCLLAGIYLQPIQIQLSCDSNSHSKNLHLLTQKKNVRMKKNAAGQPTVLSFTKKHPSIIQIFTFTLLLPVPNGFEFPVICLSHLCVLLFLASPSSFQ